MKKWALGLNDPGAYTLAADARCGPTSYTNDHIWDVRLGGGEPAALDIRTSFGLRAQGFRIFHRFVEGDKAITDPQSFAKPIQVRRFYPNFLEATFSPFTGIETSLEYWVQKSQILVGRLIITNTRLSDREIRAEVIALLAPISGGTRMSVTEIEGVKVLCGQTADISPLVFMPGVPETDTGPYPSLGVNLNLLPGSSRTITWIQTAQVDPQTAFEVATEAAQQNWDTATARLDIQNAGLIEVETGNPDWNAAFALSQKTAFSLVVGPTDQLPNPSLVTSRQVDHGYSHRGDGNDYGHLWDGQTPIEADYLSTFLLPTNPEIMAGILTNFLETQTKQGIIDWKPGLGGQRSRQMATPLLTNLAWRIYEVTEDRAFLQAVYPQLLSFVQAWFSDQLDRDGDGLPEWARTSQSGFEDHPTYSQWEEWSQGGDISKSESPALCAMLYNEIQILIKIARIIEQTGPISALLALAENLKSAIDTSWDEATATYRNWDRETHFSPNGEMLHTQLGSGDIQMEREFEQPVRLHLQLNVDEEISPQILIFIHGTGASGNHRVERLAGDHFRWNLKRGNVSSVQTYTRVEFVQIAGLTDKDQISIAVMDFSVQDQTLFLPLWAQIPSPERAFELVKQTITNPESFWQDFGISACPNTSLVENHPGNLVYPIWNAFIGSGLLKYGYQDEAATLVTRVMTGIIANLKQNKAFYNFYHISYGHGIGELNTISGLAPLKFFLETLGVQIISPRKIKVYGENPFPWDVVIRYRGVSIEKGTSKTVVRFPGDQTISINTPESRLIMLENE